ncbi:GLPGLI family protein [Flavobacterium sp. NKUCC04_CG]|uniref:GLPGLI family protein n=1 Tax=Flavobacterium sp. NKUCC04_CG TaxID=2842121 RepID=UPI001C5B68B5|nr:GLPGLI family protein [Flavobacterium sp. NKUCC04_CG]
MKTHIIKLFCILSLSGLAQTHHIAYYNIQYHFEHTDNKASTRFKSVFEDAKRHEDEVKLRLIFNKETAVFEMLTANRNSQNDFSHSLCNCEKTVFMSVPENSIRHHNSAQPVLGIKQDHYLLTEDLYSDWKLHNEVKKINEYTSYKATKTVTEPNGRSFLITAWYTPEFPFPFGPANYGGLPGLIVQIQKGSTMFVLSKIEFDRTISLPTPDTRGEVISTEAYSKLIHALIKNK